MVQELQNIILGRPLFRRSCLGPIEDLVDYCPTDLQASRSNRVPCLNLAVPLAVVALLDHEPGDARGVKIVPAYGTGRRQQVETGLRPLLLVHVLVA